VVGWGVVNDVYISSGDIKSSARTCPQSSCAKLSSRTEMNAEYGHILICPEEIQ
jgi:hypothetical protein